ncbi:flagellar biosynthetic protein FliR [Endozoicomonas ascidiicola]|uniref:flagellar biosynthetic protein FliR n=1 Tax=Endozoicomonas ascidiicola TaxID=1698521 RepID=UPI000832E530|nr:flagellar biosynthetic protein FliR [Endozoicomonas ascidiicola]
MIDVTSTELTGWIGQYLWPLFRIVALFMVMPLFSSRVVAPRVRLLMAMAITFLVSPLLPAVPAVEPLSTTALMITLQQLMIGFVMGMVLQIYFAIFTSAGEMISMQMGLGMSVMVDPINGVQIPVISQLFQLLSFLMFLAVDGHLVAISVVIESFNTIPIAPFSLANIALEELPGIVSWMFASALLMVVPAIISLLIVSFTFGVMNRSAPQFNIFSLGFPLTMLGGLIILMLVSTRFSGIFLNFTRQGLESLSQFVL